MQKMCTLGLFVAMVGVAGCEVEGDLNTQHENEETMELFGIIGGPGSGAPCSVTDIVDFEVGGTFEVTGTITNGCEDDEICAVYACNNAIPQTCYGTCTELGGGFPGFPRGF